LFNLPKKFLFPPEISNAGYYNNKTAPKKLKAALLQVSYQ